MKILIVLLLLSGCTTWAEYELYSAARECSEVEGVPNVAKYVPCKCILEEAADRWPYQEWRTYEIDRMAQLKADGVVTECMAERGGTW